jgi:FkbM family methyltransferase
MKKNKLIFKDHHSANSKETWLQKEMKDCNHTYHIPGVNTLFSMKFANKKIIAVDIGANVGAFSICASPYFDKIYAFEAAHNTYQVAKENMSHLNNIELFNLAAAGNDDEILQLASHSNNLSRDTSIFHVSQARTNEVEECKTISLEGVYKKIGLNYIDYLKVDCEGSEYDLLMDKDLSAINYLVVKSTQGI